jgi:uncharacterized protein (DUF58 family)
MRYAGPTTGTTRVADGSVIPLVPRRRLVGLAFGAVESVRRGRGFDVAATRAYQPGDPVDSIDWKASARLSTAQERDVFVVREHHAEEAPRVVLVCDRRPELGVDAAGLPVLDKPAAIAAVADLLGRSVAAAHGLLGYLDLAGGGEGGEAYWRPPRGQVDLRQVEERLDAAPWDAPADGLARALELLVRTRADVPAGSFVFVLSDFLEPVPADVWAQVLARRWELVPVVVQDPVWEQDFPPIASLVTPVRDPRSGRLALVRLSEDEVAARREEHRRRLRRLLEELEARDLVPVLVSSADPDDVLEAFHAWDARRRRERGRVW